MKKFQLHMVILATSLLYCAGLSAEEIPFAGMTPAQATPILDTTELKVQDGGNYIKFENQYLPATLSYLPDTAFGPVPVVVQDGKDTLPAAMVFEKCHQQWRWEIPQVEEATIIAISTHENARILVEPRMCPPDWDSTAVEFDSFTWRGVTYTESQDVVLTFEDTEKGCTYTHTLHLTIHHTIEKTEPKTVCDEFQWKNKTFTESGIYRLDTVPLANGDRQINFVNLTVNHKTFGEDTRTECVSYLAPWGEVLTTSDDYEGIITNAAGCDSVITLHLTIIPDCTCPPDWDSTAVEFDSFTWRGVTYTESQDVVLTFEDTEKGCTYTHTLHLTIHHTIEKTEPKTVCDEFQWKNKTFTESGIYRLDTVPLANGDRQINFVNLTVNHKTFGEDTRTECVSYLAPWGEVLTTSDDYEGIITNTAGCDSVITLHLTIIPDCTIYDTVYFCAGMNTEHDERVSDDYVKRYRQYYFQSPQTWDYMEGVILQSEQTRTQMNLRRAEHNLREHYVGDLMPIDNISWTIRYAGSETYEPLTVEDGPQWIDAGMLALQVVFRCGVVYNEQYPTDVTNIDVQSLPAKRIENGQVVIIRGGDKYNLLGTKID